MLYISIIIQKTDTFNKKIQKTDMNHAATHWITDNQIEKYS